MGFHRFFVGFYKFFIGFHRFSSVFIGFSQVFIGFPRFRWFSLSFLWVFLVFPGVLVGFPWFSYVFLGFPFALIFIVGDPIVYTAYVADNPVSAKSSDISRILAGRFAHKPARSLRQLPYVTEFSKLVVVLHAVVSSANSSFLVVTVTCSLFALVSVPCSKNMNFH